MTPLFDKFRKKAESYGTGRTRTEGYFIYCFGEGPGFPVKIGLTTDVNRRLAQLQTSTWRDIHIHWFHAGMAIHESALRKALTARKIKGEWFTDEDDFIKGFDLSDGLEPFIERLFEMSITPNTPELTA